MRVDSHRHLGGSISDRFVWNTICEKGYIWLADSHQATKEQMTFSEREPRDFHRFLDKFRLLDKITWDEELIEKSIKDAAEGLEQDRIDYTLMRFSINKYMDSSSLKWHKHEAIKFIYDCFEHYCPGKVGLVLSLKMESPRISQEQYASLVDDSRASDYLAGIDLVGDEAYFDADFYAPIYARWNEAGKMTSAHVGESQSHDNVLQAITKMRVTNVSHGFKIWDHPEIMSEAKARNVQFDLALTSNYLTGSWLDQNFHPIRTMFDFGLDVTIGTDDPVQCSTTYDGEFELLHRLGFNAVEAEIIQMTAARSYRSRYGRLHVDRHGPA